jgi:hypothetical protein
VQKNSILQISFEDRRKAKHRSQSSPTIVEWIGARNTCPPLPIRSKTKFNTRNYTPCEPVEEVARLSVFVSTDEKDVAFLPVCVSKDEKDVAPLPVCVSTDEKDVRLCADNSNDEVFGTLPSKRPDAPQALKIGRLRKFVLSAK